MSQASELTKRCEQHWEKLKDVFVNMLCFARNGCFAAGTLVATAHGAVPIEKVRLGTMVLSADHFTGEPAYRPVTRLFRTHPDQLWEVDVMPDGPMRKAEILFTAAEHPFYVMDSGGAATAGTWSGPGLATGPTRGNSAPETACG